MTTAWRLTAILLLGNFPSWPCEFWEGQLRGSREGFEKSRHLTAGNVCINGSEIHNSNRVGSNACFASKLGDKCEYQCNQGYIAIGSHVCQSLEISGALYFNRTFFGGECYRLCEPDLQCSGDTVPFRWFSAASDGGYGQCLETRCKSKDHALLDLAEGNYNLWRVARSDRSGVYVDHVSFDKSKQMGVLPGQNNYQGSTDTSGLGLMMECIADSMQWIDHSEFIDRVNVTLSAFANKLDGDWHLPRSSAGWLPRYFHVLSGEPFPTTEGGEWSVMATGLFYAGAMFVRTYLSQHDTSAAGQYLINLVDDMVKTVSWEKMMCAQQFDSATNKTIAVAAAPNDSHATGIPYLQSETGVCSNILWPTADGTYDFNEMMPTLWLAYNFACRGQLGNCTNVALENAWNAWQKIRYNPSTRWNGKKLLSEWSCYVVQFPFYTTNAFISDPVWVDGFKNMWQADQDDYSSRAFDAGDIRYGLGAGPTIPWCAAGETYTADKLQMNPNTTDCRMWSPYCIGGYLPANQDYISGQLFQLLAQGESVLLLPDFVTHREIHILGRKSLLVPTWNESDWVTMVDLSSELLGLSTIWLGDEFFKTNTNHFA